MPRLADSELQSASNLLSSAELMPAPEYLSELSSLHQNSKEAGGGGFAEHLLGIYLQQHCTRSMEWENSTKNMLLLSSGHAAAGLFRGNQDAGDSLLSLLRVQAAAGAASGWVEMDACSIKLSSHYQSPAASPSVGFLCSYLYLSIAIALRTLCHAITARCKACTHLHLRVK